VKGVSSDGVENWISRVGGEGVATCLEQHELSCIGCCSPLCLCLDQWAGRVSAAVLAIAVAAEVSVEVIGSLTGQCRVSHCTTFTSLEATARHCSVAILIAFKALDHIALTM
jgi:hypothetical protein